MDASEELSPYRATSAPVPPRPRDSIRRTSTIDADWPERDMASTRLIGRARDAITPADGGTPQVVAEDSFTALIGPDRTIAAIEADPPRGDLAALVGVRAGGHLRAALAAALPGERAAATPLHLLLDDIAGASLVAPWALTHWSEAWRARRRTLVQTMSFIDVCIGFREGSDALGSVRAHDNFGAPTVDLRDPADPEGWHGFDDPRDWAGFRRARWIDVRAGERIEVEAGFQDSAMTPAGGRRVVHEYRVSCTVDPETGRIVALTPHPQILPYSACGAAVGSAAPLIGARVSDLREAVPMTLRGPLGCTHLNDAFRALAEVPALADRLRTHRATAITGVAV